MSVLSKTIFVVLFGALLMRSAGAQTIVRKGGNDSLLIGQDIGQVQIFGDPIDKQSTTLWNSTENVEELLEGSHGISLTKRGNYAAEITMRGMASERLGMTIDGMKIFSACTDKMDPISSYVSANNLDQAHCGNGGDSKCFSSNVGGDVNFKLKEPRLNDTRLVRGNISMGGENNSSGINSAFNLNFSQKNWAVRLNGMHAKHENYHAGGTAEVPFSQYEKSNFGLSVKGKLNDHNFLLMDFILDDAKDVGYPALPMDVSYAKGRIYSLTYKHYMQGKFKGQTKLKLYGNNIRHLMDDGSREVLMHMDMPGESDTYGAYFQVELDNQNRHAFMAILDGYAHRSYAEMTMFPNNETPMFMLTWPDVHRNVLGLFASDKIKLTERKHLKVSGRLDIGQSKVISDLGKRQFEAFGYEVDGDFQHRIYSASAAYIKTGKRKDEWGFEINYSERLPTVSEQFGFFIFNSQDAYDYIGDPYIEKEKAYKAELFASKNFKKIQFNTSLFAMHLPDYILGIVDTNLDPMTLGSNGVKFYENIEYAQMMGGEFNVTWNPLQWVEMQSGFSYTYGVDYSNEPLPLVPPLKNTTSIQLHYLQNHLQFEVKSASQQLRFSEIAGETATPGYAVFNVKYIRDIKLGRHGLNMMGGVNNLFDTYYYDHLDWNSIPRMGRSFFIKLQYQFNRHG